MKDVVLTMMKKNVQLQNFIHYTINTNCKCLCVETSDTIKTVKCQENLVVLFFFLKTI